MYSMECNLLRNLLECSALIALTRTQCQRKAPAARDLSRSVELAGKEGSSGTGSFSRLSQRVLSMRALIVV